MQTIDSFLLYLLIDIQVQAQLATIWIVSMKRSHTLAHVVLGISHPYTFRAAEQQQTSATTDFFIFFLIKDRDINK